MSRSPLPRLVYGIGIAQLVSWATLYYAFAVLIVPMEADLGWRRSTLTAGFTLGLFIAALLAPFVGRVLDRHGGFWPMTAGSLLGAAALGLWSTAESVAVFWLAWALIGVAMACTFYEAGFAVVTAASGTAYRRAITTVTLIAGFAGTLAFPLTQALVNTVGWRDALVVLAVLNLLVPALLHARLLRGGSATVRSQAPGDSSAALRRARRSPAYWALLVAVVTNALMFSGVTFHVVAMLGERGYSAERVVAAWTLVGPAQVAARAGLMTLSGVMGPLFAGVVAFGLSNLALVLLMLTAPGALPPVLAAVVFGAGNGLVTIVRAATLPDMLGREGYASIAGTVALPAMLAIALGPSFTAWLWAAGGYGLAFAVLLALSFAGLLAFAAGVVWHRRREVRLKSLSPPGA